MLPVRCFTCGYIIGRHEEEYENRLEKGETKENILNSLNLSRYCCRRMFLGHAGTVDQLLRFPDRCENTIRQNSTHKF